MGLLLYLRPAAARPAGRCTTCERWPDPASLAAFGALWALSWEATPVGVYLDMAGCGRLFGGALEGAVRACGDARARWGPLSGGLGADPMVARLACGMAAAEPGSLLYVPAGSEQAFLAPFSVTVLAGRFPAQIARLRLFGVRTLGDLQNLPSALLEATFGRYAGVLADAACGRLSRGLSRGRRRDPEGRMVVRASWQRPLAGAAVESALRRSLARRALLACAGGPGLWTSWFLRVTWDGGTMSMVSSPGMGQDVWFAWQALVDGLWRRLPVRRRGLVALELRASRSEPVVEQADLFPDSLSRRRTALTESWRRLAGAPLRFASEALLDAWHIRWQVRTPAR